MDYNEPAVMRTLALSLGVPDEAIVLDYAGRRTYDTCYRAKAIFGLSEAILVTQAFHLPRAIYECNRLGVERWGWRPISVFTASHPCCTGTCANCSPQPRPCGM